MKKNRAFFLGLFLLGAAFYLQGCIVAPPPTYEAYAPVQEEIVYEHPYYVAPPIVVAYPYSHWMYVRSGNYIDVVFIGHDGHRHVEHWRCNGARMTHYNAQNWNRERYHQHKNAPAEGHKGNDVHGHKPPHEGSPQAHSPHDSYKVRPAAPQQPHNQAHHPNSSPKARPAAPQQPHTQAHYPNASPKVRPAAPQQPHNQAHHSNAAPKAQESTKRQPQKKPGEQEQK